MTILPTDGRFIILDLGRAKLDQKAVDPVVVVVRGRVCTMTAASLIKSDGTTCTHLMHDVAMTEEEGYNVQLQIARSDSKAIPMPADMKEDHFKERCYVAQLSIYFSVEI